MKPTKKHSIYIFTLAIIMIVFSGCSLTNTSPYSKGGSDELQEAATSSQEGLDSGNEENNEASNEEDSDSNEIDTSEWKTYRNEEYGFEIKYPKEVTIRKKDNEREKTIALFSEIFDFPNNDAIIISVFDNKNNKNIQQIKEDSIADEQNEYGYEYKKEFITVDGIDALQESRTDGDVYFRINIPYDIYIYEIHFSFYLDNFNNQQKKEKKIKLIDNILNTFKFIK